MYKSIFFHSHCNFADIKLSSASTLLCGFVCCLSLNLLITGNQGTLQYLLSFDYLFSIDNHEHCHFEGIKCSSSGYDLWYITPII
jgi:hypothetical protein